MLTLKVYIVQTLNQDVIGYLIGVGIISSLRKRYCKEWYMKNLLSLILSKYEPKNIIKLTKSFQKYNIIILSYSKIPYTHLCNL